MKPKCECTDPGCPKCKGKCTHNAITVLLRADMEDLSGTAFCLDCADDAFESGLFNEPHRGKIGQLLAMRK